MFDLAVVDSTQFAREMRELRGRVAVAELPRLHEMLFDRSGEIAYALNGFVSKDGKPSLRLTVSGQLVLTCQRCLGPLCFQLESTRIFELIPFGNALSDPAEEPEDVEQLYADSKLDVIALVEDEVLLGLPMVAGHQAGACEPPAADDGIDKRESPFSVLAALKRQ